MARYVIRFARRAGIVVLFAVTAIAGTATGLLFAYADDLPQISALDDYAPSIITRVYDINGEVIGEFAVERRVVLGYDEIAPVLRQAIIASEDGEFEQHFGLSVSRIITTVRYESGSCPIASRTIAHVSERSICSSAGTCQSANCST